MGLEGHLSNSCILVTSTHASHVRGQKKKSVFSCSVFSYLSHALGLIFSKAKQIKAHIFLQILFGLSYVGVRPSEAEYGF